MSRVLVLSLTLCMAFAGIAGEADINATTAAAKKAADYLLKQSNDDGTFGQMKGPAVPGVVSLVIKSLASSPDKYREENAAVAKAVKYLLGKQVANGSVTMPNGQFENYITSCGVLALTSLENPAHNEAIAKAKKYILSCQLAEDAGYNKDEHARGYGSFGYGNSKRGDLSNTGFSLEALKAAGLEENSPAWKNAVTFIKRCQDNEETNDVAEMKGGPNEGGFVYLPGDSEFKTIKTKSGKEYPKPYGNMTYMAIKSLIYCGVDKNDPALQAAFKWVKNNYSVEKNPGGEGGQGYFYYTVAFAKAFTASGMKEIELADGTKRNWAKDLATQLIKLQKPDGSFVNEADRWMESDPVLTTAYALDALNLCIAAMK